MSARRPPNLRRKGQSGALKQAKSWVTEKVLIWHMEAHLRMAKSWNGYYKNYEKRTCVDTKDRQQIRVRGMHSMRRKNIMFQ